MHSNLDFSELGGLVLTPGHPEYHKYGKLWNNRYKGLRPNIINVIDVVDDIRKAILFCKKTGLDFRIKSGGHNYEGFSMVNGGFVLNLSKLKALQINTKEQTCTFGPGWLMEDLYAALKKGDQKFIMAGGICPYVSAIPVLLGGGTGIYHRKFGLTCDTVTSLTIMTNKGVSLVCNAEQNQDLFWACRGAGNGNFGVITSVTVKIFPAPHAHNFRIVWKWDENVILNWQRWLKTASNDLSSVNLDLGDYSSIGKPSTIICKGLSFGSKEDCDRFTKVLRAMRPLPIDYEVLAEEGHEVGNLACGYSARDPEQKWGMEAGLFSQKETADSDRWKSTGLLSNSILSIAAIKQMGQLMERTPKSFTAFSIALVGLGGEVKEMHPSETAYPHRQSDFMMRIVGKWQDRNFDQINLDFHLAMKTFLAEEMESAFYYFNYSDLEISDYLYSYFVDNQQRLKEVKSKYDSSNFFTSPQGLVNK